MKNFIGTPVTSTLSGSITPADGTEPIPWSDTKTLKPPAATDFPRLKNEKSEFLEKSKASPSWRKAKQNGTIVMLPYSRGKTSVEFSVARVPFTQYYYGLAGRYSVDCSTGILIKDFKYHDFQMSYTEQGDWAYWLHERKVPSYAVTIDFSSQVEQVKTALLAKLNTSYDLLTEIAEGKDSIRLIASMLKALAHPLQAFKKEKERLYKSFHRGEIKTYSHLLKRVADAWMTCRYGVMPLVYSIQDILKTIKLKDALFHTERAGDEVNLKDFEKKPWIKPSLYLQDTVSGSIKIRAVGKDGYSAGSTLQLSDLIGFNPAVTIWEKIPYSFVVDWALNVGDYLSAGLGSLSSLADQRVCCYSIRCNYEIETRLHWDLNQSYKTSNPGRKECGDTITLFEGWDVSRGGQVQGSALVRREKVDTFHRVVFDAGDISLAWNVQMNGKRILDSLAITFNQTRKRISALR